MKDTKEYLLVLKKILERKIISDTDLSKYVSNKSKIILTRRIKFLKYLGFKIGTKKINNHKYYYLK